MSDVPTVPGESAALIRYVFGDLFKDLVGLGAGDFVSEVRKRNADKLRRRTEEILKERDAKAEPDAVNLKHVVLIRAEAEFEGREELQEMWARLMAAALDPHRANNVRKAFIEAVRKFEPSDALALSQFRTVATWSAQNMSSVQKRGRDAALVTLDHLVKLDCLEVDVGRAGALPYYKITAFGMELLRALY